jgi:hypothetical protein
MASINASIAQALLTVPPGHKGALMAITSRNPDGTFNANAALVHKVNDDFKVMAWLGRSWPGGVSYGAAATVTW